ncbi:MAG: hypothetical protein ACLP5H_11435 [Desulfomonilaceae bacterium]
MDQPLARKYSGGSNPVSMKMNRAVRITARIVALATVSVLLFIGHGFCTERQSIPTAVWSRVQYDPNLTEDLLSRLLKMVSLSTDNCYLTSFGTKNGVVCKLILTSPDHIAVDIAKQVPESASLDVCSEVLKGSIINGMFTCYYIRVCYAGCGNCKATTKRKELTLDKKTYQKGDVVTGRINFECLYECPGCLEKPEPIIVKGIFQTILK